jgi:hypothetical protein
MSVYAAWRWLRTEPAVASDSRDKAALRSGAAEYGRNSNTDDHVSTKPT